MRADARYDRRSGRFAPGRPRCVIHPGGRRSCRPPALC